MWIWRSVFRQSLGTLPSKFWEFFENGDIWNDFGNKMDYGRIFEIFWEIFEKERGSIINLESTYPCLYIKFHPFEPKFDFRMDFRTFFHVKFSGKFTLFMTWVFRKDWFDIETSHRNFVLWRKILNRISYTRDRVISSRTKFVEIIGGVDLASKSHIVRNRVILKLRILKIFHNFWDYVYPK